MKHLFTNADQIKKMIDQIQSLQKNVVRMEKEKDLMKLEFNYKLNTASTDFEKTHIADTGNSCF
jgi:hypothetical protein